MTLIVHPAHHTASTLDYPPADPNTVAMSVAAQEPQPALAVKVPHKAMENPELEVADKKGLVWKSHFPLTR